MKSRDRKILIFFWLLLSALLILSLPVGRYSLNLRAIFSEGLDRQVFLSLRLPRTLFAALAGAALSLSGSVYQTVFQNPLASPDIIGTASGASVGAALAILMSLNRFLTGASAFVFGMMTVVLTYLLSRLSRGKSIATLLLSGVVMNALCQAILMAFKSMADPEKELAAIEFWLMGSLSDVTAQKILPVLPLIMLGFLGIYLLRRPITLLSLSDDEAGMLGIRVRPMRLCALALSTMMTGAVISVCGLVSFIGLLPPHIARLTMRHNKPSAWLLSALCGACLMLVADILCRVISVSEIPLSIITSILGAPALLILLLTGGIRHE